MVKPDSKRHHRRSIRLQGSDYSQEGACYVTICTHDRECVFGDVVDEEVKLSNLGRVAERRWEDLPHRFLAVDLDEFVVMPNHFHGIIVINADGGELIQYRRGLINQTPTNKHQPHVGTEWILMKNPSRWEEDDENPRNPRKSS